MGSNAASCAEVALWVFGTCPNPQTVHHPLVVGITLTTLGIALAIRTVSPVEHNAITFNELAADVGAATIILGGEILAIVLLLGAKAAVPDHLYWVWALLPTIVGAIVMNFARIELRALRQRGEHMYTVTDHGAAFALMLLSVFFLCVASELTAHYIPLTAHGH